MAKTHIIAHDSEILTKGKTLDRKLKEIESKVDNIDVDGTLIATASKLGNVKIGDNINVTNDGTISVKSVGKNGVKGIVTIDTLIQSTDVGKFVGSTIGVANQTENSPLQIKKASNTAYGVVKIGSGLSVNAETGALEASGGQVEIVNVNVDSPNPSSINISSDLFNRMKIEIPQGTIFWINAYLSNDLISSNLAFMGINGSDTLAIFTTIRFGATNQYTEIKPSE